VICLSDDSSRSLQTLAFPIEFVHQYQLLGRLSQFCIGRLPRTGGSNAASCRIFRFPHSDVLHEKITQDRRNRRQQHAQKATFLQNFSFSSQRRLFRGQSSEVVTSATKVFHLTSCERNISFHNILSALAHAMDEPVVAFPNVVASGFFTQSANALKRG